MTSIRSFTRLFSFFFTVGVTALVLAFSSHSAVAQVSRPSETNYCTQDMFDCGGGVYVGRDPNNGCQFLACPDENARQASPSPLPKIENCVRAGCNSELCVPASQAGSIVTTCAQQPEFACYANAACERQTSGECGFTMTSTVQACLDNVKTAPSSSPSPDTCTERPACLDDPRPCRIAAPPEGWCPTPTFSIADFNKDGQVDEADFKILRADFIKNEKGLITDLNRDGRVNIRDHAIFVREMRAKHLTN